MLEIEINESDFRIPAGRPAEIVLIIKNRENKKESARLKIVPQFKMQNMELEWRVDIEGIAKSKESVLVSGNEPKAIEHEIDVPKMKNKDVFIHIFPPKASEIGDRGVFNVLVEDDVVWSKEVSITVESAIVAIKTQIGHEIKVARELGLKARSKHWDEIYAILAPFELKGYVLVETSRPDKVLSVIRGLRGAKGVVRGEMKIEDVKHYLTPTPTITTISKGDIVELVEGPFKGEHARVIDLDEAKNEITVELFEAMVPIPITVKAEAVRVIERGEDNGSNS